MSSIPALSIEAVENFTKLELFAIIQTLQEQVTQLQAEVAALRKNSSTSSKPPSSDIVKPPRATSGNTGKSGGQKGHPGFFRKLFPIEKVDEIQEHKLLHCPSCQLPLGAEHETEPWIHQITELPQKWAEMGTVPFPTAEPAPTLVSEPKSATSTTTTFESAELPIYLVSADTLSIQNCQPGYTLGSDGLCYYEVSGTSLNSTTSTG